MQTSRTKRSSDFLAHLEQLDRAYSPKPGQPVKPVVLVEDNGPIHTSKLSQAALAARAHWLTVEWLPKYAPELNDIERVWRNLKAYHLAHQTFADANALEQAIHHAVNALNTEQMPRPFVKSLPKVTPFSRANPTPLEVSDRLFEVEDRRAVGLRGVIAEVLGSRSFSPCRTPVVAR